MRRFDLKIGKKKTRGISLLAAGLAAVILASAIHPVTLNAKVADESTLESSVKGTKETYYRTITTNYHAGNILGMVSKTNSEDMIKAANITGDERRAGYEPVLYINSFAWDSDERKAAEKVVEKMNGTLVTMVDVQLFRYEVSAFAPVHDAGQMVTMIMGIPEKASRDGDVYKVLVDWPRDFAMVRVHNGEVTVLKDLDDDPKTLTFQTDKFSAFGLMYAPEGAVDEYLNGGNAPAASQNNNTSQPSQNTSAGELDDVPKTGDILWEIEYGYAD